MTSTICHEPVVLSSTTASYCETSDNASRLHLTAALLVCAYHHSFPQRVDFLSVEQRFSRDLRKTNRSRARRRQSAPPIEETHWRSLPTRVRSHSNKQQQEAPLQLHHHHLPWKSIPQRCSASVIRHHNGRTCLHCSCLGFWSLNWNPPTFACSVPASTINHHQQTARSARTHLYHYHNGNRPLIASTHALQCPCCTFERYAARHLDCLLPPSTKQAVSVRFHPSTPGVASITTSVCAPPATSCLPACGIDEVRTDIDWQ